jgi:hypothetical protein
MITAIVNLTAGQLREVADLKDRIEALYSDIARILGSPNQVRTGAARRSKRTMSTAARARMAAAARARWAKLKKGTPPPTRKQKRKRTMSAAVKAKLAAIARARWRKAKAQGKSAL